MINLFNKIVRRFNPKIILYIFIATIIILAIPYGFIIKKNIGKSNFSKNVIDIAEKNENTIFSIEKLDLYSSANVIDNSVNKNLQDLNVYQYADIAIQINNRKSSNELTNENTVKQLYIDNISITPSSELGTKSLNYTNSLVFSKNTDIQNTENVDRIDFDIIYTNNENNNADYSKPSFYTDCSNPITLKYVNKDLVTGYSLSQDSAISFDGKLLGQTGVAVDDLKCNVKFRINIVNNNNENFSCWVNFDIPLDGLYEKGKITKIADVEGNIYNFLHM